jgi:hypothetical protein
VGVTNEEDELAVSVEMAIWMAGHDAALERVAAGYAGLIEPLESMRFVMYEGFVDTLRAAVRGVHSYRNGWHGLPVPEREAAQEQIRKILDEVPENSAHASTDPEAVWRLFQDFMAVTPGEMLRDKLEWIRTTKEERVRALERVGRIPSSSERLAELVWVWWGGETGEGDAAAAFDIGAAHVVAITAPDLPSSTLRPAALRAWKKEEPDHRRIFGPELAVRFVDEKPDVFKDRPAGRTVIHPIDDRMDLAEHATRLERWERHDEIRARALEKRTEEERDVLGLCHEKRG